MGCKIVYYGVLCIEMMTDFWFCSKKIEMRLDLDGKKTGR